MFQVSNFKHDPMEQRKQLAAQNWYMLYNFKSAAHTYSKAKNAHSTPLQQTNDTTIGAQLITAQKAAIAPLGCCSKGKTPE